MPHARSACERGVEARVETVAHAMSVALRGGQVGPRLQGKMILILSMGSLMLTRATTIGTAFVRPLETSTVRHFAADACAGLRRP